MFFGRTFRMTSNGAVDKEEKLPDISCPLPVTAYRDLRGRLHTTQQDAIKADGEIKMRVVFEKLAIAYQKRRRSDYVHVGYDNAIQLVKDREMIEEIFRIADQYGVK